MSCLFHSVLYFPHNYHMVKEEKWEYRCDLKKIKYNKVNSNCLFHDQFQRSVLVLFAQGVSVQGINVLGGKCSGGTCPGVICPKGYMS